MEGQVGGKRELMVAPCRLAMMEEVRREQIQGMFWREKQPHLLMEDVGNERKRGIKLLSHWTEKVFIWHVQETGKSRFVVRD